MWNCRRKCGGRSRFPPPKEKVSVAHFSGVLQPAYMSGLWGRPSEPARHRLRATAPDRQIAHLVAGAAGDDRMDRLGRTGDTVAGLEHVALDARDVPAVVAGDLLRHLERQQEDL